MHMQLIEMCHTTYVVDRLCNTIVEWTTVTDARHTSVAGNMIAKLLQIDKQTRFVEILSDNTTAWTQTRFHIRGHA